MKKVITEYRCDICKNEKNEKELQNVDLPFVCNIDQTEGRAQKRYITFQNVDICADCLERFVVAKWGWRAFDQFILGNN